MTVTPVRAAVVGLLAVCAVPFAAPTAGRGQPPAAATPDDVKKLQNLGADACRRCHREPQPEDVRDKVTDFVRLDEFTVWKNQDLHAKAFEVLSGPLGKQMGDALGWGDVSKRVECLACHAVNLSQELTAGVPRPARTPDEFYTKDGVGCEACHGVADKWFRPHFDKSWRSETPEKKLAAGERDMRDPVARADRCASCHVGNWGEGKFVTHAMFAAGHPPLPPLESMTFSRDQPMHYIPPRDNKYFADLDADAAWKLFHYRKGQSASARQMAVGAAAGFGTAMKTLAAAAEDARSGGLLDFALFDCAACHHDLITPSWRQDRGFAGTPGRPQPRSGPTMLLKAVAGDEAGAFNSRFAALTKACEAKPFGDPAAIAAAARDMAGWADGVAKSLGEANYPDARVAKLRRDIAGAAGRKGPDYDNAQQLLWAVDALKDENPAVPAKVAGELAKLGGLPGSDTPMIGPLWEKGKWEAGKRPLVAETLSRRLGRYSLFEQNPDSFRRTFEKIAAELGTSGQ
jgi:hypothetical protein